MRRPRFIVGPAVVLALAFLLVRPCANAADFRTNDGTEYKGVTVSRVEPDGIVVVTSTGVVKLYFVELPADVRQKHGYDPVAADQFRARVQAANEQAKKASEAARQQRQKELQAATQTPPQKQPPSAPTATPWVATSSTLDPPTGETWAINGVVLQRIKNGALISCVKTNEFGMRQPEDGAIVFVAGEFSDIVDDDRVKIVGRLNGTFEYPTVLGSGKTVRAFQAASIRRVERR